MLRDTKSNSIINFHSTKSKIWRFRFHTFYFWFFSGLIIKFSQDISHILCQISLKYVYYIHKLLIYIVSEFYFTFNKKLLSKFHVPSNRAYTYLWKSFCGNLLKFRYALCFIYKVSQNSLTPQNLVYISSVHSFNKISLINHNIWKLYCTIWVVYLSAFKCCNNIYHTMKFS